jgi:hypothetical protein
MVIMGTSRAAKAPPTKKWNNVIASLKAPERNANTVLNVAFEVAINTLPTTSPVSVPIAFGVSEGLRFAVDVRESGLDRAVRRGAIRVSERYVVPSISGGLWDIALSKMDPKFSNSPFGRLAEIAFKKTMNQIMSKGAEALARKSD